MGVMAEHRIGTREEYDAARDDLLREEKELTRRSDELARKRRELPWVPVEHEYSFETEDGTKTLADLFDGRSQLLVYRFVFGPPYEVGCPVCSSIADTLDPQVVHLKARDSTLLLASRAPSGSERVCALGRDRLPDLREHPPRTGARDGLLRPAGPDAEGSRRERFGAVVDPPTRRVLEQIDKGEQNG